MSHSCWQRGGDPDEHVHYIYAGGTRVAQYTVTDNTNTADNTTVYFHQDHLESVDTVTDHLGAVIERLSYDPHGKRRNDDWTDASIGITPANSPRGFTDHEHLDSLTLIHMNGRVYDPVIGRFVSADPFVQFPDSTQGLNRYSYVANNPLSITDPTGFHHGPNGSPGRGARGRGAGGPGGEASTGRTGPIGPRGSPAAPSVGSGAASSLGADVDSSGRIERNLSTTLRH